MNGHQTTSNYAYCQQCGKVHYYVHNSLPARPYFEPNDSILISSFNKILLNNIIHLSLGLQCGLYLQVS